MADILADYRESVRDQLATRTTEELVEIMRTHQRVVDGEILDPSEKTRARHAIWVAEAGELLSKQSRLDKLAQDLEDAAEALNKAYGQILLRRLVKHFGTEEVGAEDSDSVAYEDAVLIRVRQVIRNLDDELRQVNNERRPDPGNPPF